MQKMEQVFEAKLRPFKKKDGIPVLENLTYNLIAKEN